MPLPVYIAILDQGLGCHHKGVFFSAVAVFAFAVVVFVSAAQREDDAISAVAKHSAGTFFIIFYPFSDT
ncbi:Uncharacterised protein [Acinetobacter haemolyticus]|nr:Uncharacterised protein [Acinetobacter haemolyticus]